MKILVLIFMFPLLAGALETMPKAQWEFVSKYCTDCHDEEMEEGNVNLDFEKVDWSSAKVRLHWDRAYTMLERGKMPPKKKKKQPTVEERQNFMRWLDQKLMVKTSPGGTPIRRLNKREYQETIRSVFGIKDFKLPASFPQDINSHGFDTEAKTLVVSPSHFEAYHETAVKVADYLFPPKKAPVKKSDWEINPEDLTISYSSAYMVDGAMRLASRGGKTRNATWPTKFETPVSGTYRVEILLSSKNPPTTKPIMWLKSHFAGRGGKERSLADLKVEKGEPQKFVKTVNLYRGETLLFYYKNAPFKFDDKKAYKNVVKDIFTKDPRLAAAWMKVKNVVRGGIGWARLKEAMNDPALDVDKYKPGSKLFEKAVEKASKNAVSSGETLIYKYFEEGPNIGIHKVKITGPLKVVEDQKMKTRKKIQAEFLGTYSGTIDAELNKFLNSYLYKAFRRKVSKSEAEEYADLVKKEVAAGSSIEEGLHLAVRTSLMSPSFLYRETSSKKMTQTELASRLSYFLTSAPPDSEIMEKVEKGILHNSGTLRYQAGRLLKSFKGNKFIHDFTSQWLDTDALDSIMPDPKLIKRFTSSHKDGMKKEVETTFREILLRNMSVMEFIDPDFIYTNSAVGKDIYGFKSIPKAGKGTLPKVKIKRGTRQGGILAMPAVMMATANGVDTQAVLRGVWILDNVLGTPPPEPPKNVPALPPDTAGAKDPRDKLKKHMDSASCKSCHEDIDPMGFVLENFDPIGRWRETYPRKGKEKPLKIDSSATMPNGTKLKDVRDLKKFLLENPKYFTGCLARKLMTYATGRPLNYHEKKIIDEIVDKNIASGNKFHDLLIDLIDSEVFRSR